MFTLEDLDLTEELEFFRAHGMDVMHAGDLPHDVVRTADGADETATAPEADARLHPDDYFIVGL